jgi:hypothetical protein
MVLIGTVPYEPVTLVTTVGTHPMSLKNEKVQPMTPSFFLRGPMTPSRDHLVVLTGTISYKQNGILVTEVTTLKGMWLPKLP